MRPRVVRPWMALASAQITLRKVIISIPTHKKCKKEPCQLSLGRKRRLSGRYRSAPRTPQPLTANRSCARQHTPNHASTLGSGTQTHLVPVSTVKVQLPPCAPAFRAFSTPRSTLQAKCIGSEQSLPRDSFIHPVSSLFQQ